MRKFKKIITTVLAASIITTCTPVSIPSVSYAAGVTEYTSATDLELNKAHMITLQYKDSAGEINYTWYKFNAVPETEIEISATSLNGYGLEYYIYDSILQSVYTNGGRGTRTITLNKDTTYYIRFRSYNADNQVSMIIKGETSAPAATPTIAPIVAIEVPASGQTATPTAAPTATPTVVPTATPTVA
ncbi:MAG TPA: hypothetical protein DCZ23_06875, partial [Lachnospiraceae bacterium]|nr:hypothetical protein [Lachnospiraceae bacterium]